MLSSRKIIYDYIYLKLGCYMFECLILDVARGFLGREQCDDAEGQGDQLLYLSYPLVMHRCSTAVRKRKLCVGSCQNMFGDKHVLGMKAHS